MNHGLSYHPCDAVDNSYHPPVFDSFPGAPAYDSAGYQNCPTMSAMNVNARSPSSPSNALATPNTGPFVTMHIDYYLSLMRRLEAPFEPSEMVTGHVSESATNVGEAVVTPTIHVPSREEAPPALGGAQNPTVRTQGRGHPVGKPHGKRSKIACYACSDAHKTCDQGRPCERCTKRGIDASCVYPSIKGGRRVRKAVITPTNSNGTSGEKRGGMSSTNDSPRSAFFAGVENQSDSSVHAQ